MPIFYTLIGGDALSSHPLYFVLLVFVSGPEMTPRVQLSISRFGFWQTTVFRKTISFELRFKILDQLVPVAHVNDFESKSLT